MKKMLNKSTITSLFAALFLCSAPAMAQTYYPITAPDGGNQTAAGVTVTVTGSGSFDEFDCGGLETPYWEGIFDLPGSYTWTFSSAVEGIRMKIGAVDGNDVVTAYVNGVMYPITAANLSDFSPKCYGTVDFPVTTAVANGGAITNPVYPVGDGVKQDPGSIQLDINPGGATITSFALQSQDDFGGYHWGNGVTNDFSFTPGSTPPPDTPTLSEWGLITFTLLLLSFGMVFVYRRQNSLAIAGAMSEDIKPSTFDRSLYFKALGGVLVVAIAGLATAYRVFGTLTLTDTLGTLASACIVAYMVQLSMLMKKK